VSHLITEDLTELKVDVLRPINMSANIMTLQAPSTFTTDITVTSNSITLYSGSSYYIEAVVQSFNPAGAGSVPGACFYQLYNATGSAYIGNDAGEDLTGTTGAPLRQGRKCAAALILDSDISTSMTVELRIKTLTGAGWNFDVLSWNTPGAWIGFPSMRVWQLPS
jgi:hypothetical protein